MENKKVTLEIDTIDKEIINLNTLLNKDKINYDETLTINYAINVLVEYKNIIKKEANNE